MQPAYQGFQPPKYIESLIGTINDGARAAQTSALFLLFVALFLTATVISTTDEDLLRETTTQISQIGVKVPVVVSYALAPVVFLFLHVHALIRYDLLAANLRLFNQELDRHVPLQADRARCRALLANVEFVQVLAAPLGAPERSRLFRMISWLVLAGIPVTVFLAVQISFLRYQSEGITLLHRLCLIADILVLTWFFGRHCLANRAARQMSILTRGRRMALLIIPLLFVLAFNFAFMGVPSPNSTTVKNGWSKEPMWHQPLDLVLCPYLGFGCRYLRLDHRLLIANEVGSEVLARLKRESNADLDQDLAHVEGLFLRYRSLRFADFEHSRLYESDLIYARLQGSLLRFTKLQGSDLRFAQLQGADLRHAWLQGTDLREAQLHVADLSEAQLQGADLHGTRLQGADLSGAGLQGANLANAGLQGTDLSVARLQGANLRYVSLQGANLRGAELQGADLAEAWLEGANLRGAELQGADLSGAVLQGANLRGAELQGADLSFADLRGANLRGVTIWRTDIDEQTDLSLTDLRSMHRSPMRMKQLSRILQSLTTIPDERERNNLQSKLKARLGEGPDEDALPAFTLKEIALVDDPHDPMWANVDKSLLTTDERAFDAQLVPYLAQLASWDSDIAHSIVRRVTNACRYDRDECWRRALYPNLARRLLDTVREHLSEDKIGKLTEIAERAGSPDTP